MWLISEDSERVDPHASSEWEKSNRVYTEKKERYVKQPKVPEVSFEDSIWPDNYRAAERGARFLAYLVECSNFIT